MMKSRHNQYVSTPNWFTSQPIVETNVSTTSTPVQYPMFSGGGSGGVGSISLYNKAIKKELELTTKELIITDCAVVVIDIEDESGDPEVIIPKKGELTSKTGWSSSNYIEVVEESNLTLNTSYDLTQTYGIAFYDLTRKFVGGFVTSREEQLITVPKKSRYFRVCSQVPNDTFSVKYTSPESYTIDTLNAIYDGEIESFIVPKYDDESIHAFNTEIDTLSLVVDSPLKLEMDSKNNIHLNMNDLAATGQFVTTTEEQQQVEGIKTFDNGIGIGDYLLVPDRLNNAIKLVHRSEVFPMEDDPETEVDESIPTQFGNFYTSGWLSALGVSKGDGTQEPRQALYELDDVLRNETGNGILGAEEGSVLTFDGSHWYATKIEHPKGMQEDDVLDILKIHQYLTKPVADQRYLFRDLFKKIFTVLKSDGTELTNYEFSNIDNFENLDIHEIRVNYNLWSTGSISALGKQQEVGSANAALYQLDDVLSNGSLVQGARNGSVLMFDGSHWYADTIEIPDVITMADVQNHLNTLNYLKKPEALELFYTKEQSDERYLFKNLFEQIFTLFDTSGNIISLQDLNEDSIINLDSVRVNSNMWAIGFVSAFGKQTDGSSGYASALYQLNDVLASGSSVSGAKVGSVLTYDGSHWYAAEIEQNETINESDIIEILDVRQYVNQSYLKNNKYLTEPDAKLLFMDINAIQIASTESEALNGTRGVLYILM